MWSDVMELFRNYMGTGMIVIWYLISLIYLWINEKRMHVRILFLYVPIALLLVYFNPLSVKLVHGVVGSDIYWRILWLLPVSATIAYVCVCVYGAGREKTPGGPGRPVHGGSHRRIRRVHVQQPPVFPGGEFIPHAGGRDSYLQRHPGAGAGGHGGVSTGADALCPAVFPHHLHALWPGDGDEVLGP